LEFFSTIKSIKKTCSVYFLIKKSLHLPIAIHSAPAPTLRMQPAGHGRPARCRTSGGRRPEDGDEEGRSVRSSPSLSLHPPPCPEGVCSPRPYFFAPTGVRQCHAYARAGADAMFIYTLQGYQISKRPLALMNF